MKKIILPTDFSPEAAKAIPVAAQLARLFDADLHLIHVLPPVLTDYMPRIHTTDTQYHRALDLVGQAFDKIRALPCLSKLRVQTHVLTAIEPVGLLDDKRFADADLLVMTSTGASGLKETLIGSNAERLIRQATIPVLVLKNTPDHLAVKTVVFASDFEDHYDSSIDFLNTLFDGLAHPAIHLLFVNTISRFVPTHEIKPRMESFADRYALVNYTLNQQDEVDVETGVLAFAREKKADLIVLGTHGRQGLWHLLQGSIAEDIANHALIPVLTLPLQAEHVPTVFSDGFVVTPV